MLKDRRYESSGCFYVMKDAVGSARQLYYKFFSLEEDFEDLSDLISLPYWEPKNEGVSRIRLEEHCFVLLVEMEYGRVVERDWFYSSVEAAKSELLISVRRNKKYGKNAYMITIEWAGEEAPESINSRYIYLKNRQREERYCFLTELLSPFDPYGKRRIDQYVFELPQEERLDNYMIYIEPMVRERYLVSVDM